MRFVVFSHRRTSLFRCHLGETCRHTPAVGWVGRTTVPVASVFDPECAVALREIVGGVVGQFRTPIPRVLVVILDEHQERET